MSRLLIVSSLALIVTGLGFYSASAADEGRSVQVETVLARQQEVQDTVSGYGTVSASEEAMADISFPHAGQLTDLEVRVGQKVRRGDPLVTITSDPATLQSYQKASTSLQFAERESTRMQDLRQQHLATNAQSWPPHSRRLPMPRPRWKPSANWETTSPPRPRWHHSMAMWQRSRRR